MSNTNAVNRIYKDSLFKHIFGNENYKGFTLTLFNAINGTNYTNPDDVKITTLKDVLYVNVHNDVAFILNDTLSLYEQQSTWNPNMPLRFLAYLVKELEQYVEKHKINIYSTKKCNLPTPKCICFYNGTKKHKALEVLRLSNMYKGKGDLEVTVSVYNLNVEQSALKNCKPLMEYAWFVNKVNKNKEKYANLKIAIDKALDEVPKNFVLHDLLEKERNEVMSILQTEYSAEQHGEAKYQDGYEEGIEKGIEKGIEETQVNFIQSMYNNGISIDQISTIANISIDKVKEIISNKG